LSPEFVATYKEVTDYAKARGIRSLVYALHPCVGLRSELPDVPQRCLTGIGRDTYEHYVRCWSMDEERRSNAARLGKFLQATGITDAGFHDWDTGAFLSPANWGQRCEVCRRRWGDDFAAATINKHHIYYEEIKKAAPDCRLHFTLYPYNISILSQATAEQYHIDRYGPGPSVPDVARRLRERFTDFWVRCTDGLPPDVTFCIRENIPENVRRFHEITAPHGTFAWYKSGSEQWHTFFDESPRWAGTFYSGQDDLLFNVSLERFVPLKAMAVREYTWNIHAPGATGWAQLPQDQRQRHGEAKGEIYEIVLPHIVRNFFGRRAAPELVRALSLNMAVNHVFDHLPSPKRQIPVLTNYEQWKWQADQATKGSEIMDGLFEKFIQSEDRLGMTPYAARRLVYIREVFHSSKWMAQAKAENMLARELATEGKLEEAREAIRRGKQVIADAREDMDRLVAQRPEDPIYNAKDDPDKPALWKIYTPGNRVDYGVPESMLAATEKELPALAAAGEMPADTVERLATRSTVHVAPTSEPLDIDGRVDEPDWQRAEPAEAFFTYPGGQGIARAHTRARFLRDDNTLYFGVTCWTPGDAPIRAEDREHDGKVTDDRVATVVDFALDVRASRVLRDVRVRAEAYDESGRLHRRQLVKELDHLPFHWNPDEEFTIGFERQVEKGGVRVILESSDGQAERWIRIGGWQGTPELGSIFSPPAEDAAVDDFRATQGLAGPCYFAGETFESASKESHRILGQRQGTIEFWFKPHWLPKHPLDRRATRMPRHTLFHCGILRKEHPENFNCSSVTVYFESGSDALHFTITNRQYVAWHGGARAESAPWMQPGWHHLACVWDHDTAPNDWLQFYVDGTRVNAKTTVNKPERLGEDKAVELDKTTYAVQLGSLNTGRFPAGAVLDDLRISRTARYPQDFTPSHKPADLDSQTTALFHFDGNLHGEGVTEAGERYPIEAIAGTLERH
jgi:hypothetical protein